MPNRDNYHTLLVSILAQCSPETAYVRLFGKEKVTNPHVEEMIKLREQGWTYQAIGDFYGMKKHTVVDRIGRKGK